MNKIDVLDKGYVRLVDHLGSDLTIVNSARVSYDKQVDELSEKDKGLINFLATHDHTSPFRHGMLQFEVFAPLMIARQWWKYVAGSDHTMEAWNESSRRYLSEQPEFYIIQPNEWRSTPDNSKQGSGAILPLEEGEYWTQELIEHVDAGIAKYELAIARGVCAEQARAFLSAYNLYVRWYWTGSVQSVSHLINQRTKQDAQFEFQLYANAVKELASEKFPIAIDKLTGGNE